MKKKITISLLGAFVLLNFFISPNFSSESHAQINLEMLSACADESVEEPPGQIYPSPSSEVPSESWFWELLNTLFE